MNMKNIRKRKGSSLVLILIVMSVLMILGTAMLTLAVSSYKYRSLEQNRKTNLYASEAGLDVAYETIWQFAEKGIEQGNLALKKYDENFEKLIKNELKKIKNNPTGSLYFKIDGSINDDTVSADRENVFKDGYKEKNGIYDSKSTEMIGNVKGFKDFILNGNEDTNSEDSKDISKGGLERLQNKLEDYKMLEGNNSIKSEEISLSTEVTKDSKENFDYNKPLDINITSLYKKNSIERTISATYQLIVPRYDVQYSLPTKVVKIPKNPIWSKALMVNGDMKINGGNVVIGDAVNFGNSNNTGIYVGGATSGIDLRNPTATLKVTGNVVTNKNLKLSYNADNTIEDKNVEIKGNIYGRNIIIDNNILTDAEGNRIKGQQEKVGKIYAKELDETRDGSVYLMDDLEINGEKSTVDIEGSYYGVSDGSEGERNNPDNSSSIIINTEDIGNRIGEDGTSIISHNIEDSTLNIGKDVYIAGTSYIDLFNSKYQTGESISIKGNYRAYTEVLPFSDEYIKNNANANIQFKEDSVTFDYLDPLTLVTKYNKTEVDMSRAVKAILEKDRYVTVSLTQKGKDDEEYKGVISYSIIYKNIESKITSIGKTVKFDTPINNLDNAANGPIVTVKLYKLGNVIKEEPNISLVSSVDMNAFDKSEYFQEYYKQFLGNSALNLGEGVIINKSIDNTSNRENIHSGNIFTSQNKDNTVVTGNWSIDLDRKIKARSIQMKNQLFYMGRANDYEGSTINIDSIKDTTAITDSKYYEIDNKTEPVVTITNSVNFNNLATKCEVKNNEVLILDNNENSTYVLKGKTPTDLSGILVDLSSGNEYKGVIITKGDVIITGEVNFKGTIICGGDLTFEGAGGKNITYDKVYIENFAINNYEIFKTAFNDVGQYVQNNDNNYLFAKVYNNINSSSSSATNNQLIKRTKWKLIK